MRDDINDSCSFVTLKDLSLLDVLLELGFFFVATAGATAFLTTGVFFVVAAVDFFAVDFATVFLATGFFAVVFVVVLGFFVAMGNVLSLIIRYALHYRPS